MIGIGPEIIAILLPGLLSVPAYIPGRKLFFKNIPQSAIHTIKSGRIFTFSVFIVHIILVVVLYMLFFF